VNDALIPFLEFRKLLKNVDWYCCAWGIFYDRCSHEASNKDVRGPLTFTCSLLSIALHLKGSFGCTRCFEGLSKNFHHKIICSKNSQMGECFIIANKKYFDEVLDEMGI